MDIELLLVHADDHGPVLEDGLSLESAGLAPEPAWPPSAGYLRYDSRDPDDLGLQRWGVIAPEGPAGDRLLALIDPLRRAREQAQGGPARIYRVPARMRMPEAHAWKDTVYRDERVPEEERPRYLLLLGDLDQVDLSLQQALAGDAFVGRLALPDEGGYEAYADKVLRWERHREAAARALFCTVRDGTPATILADRALMAPSVATCRARRDSGLLNVGEIAELGHGGPSLGGFLDAVARPGPGLLFTISHGLGAPRDGWRSADEQRALQGAMSFGRDGRLAAEDLAGRPFLPGGMWFFLACYGGATPTESAYHIWLDRLHAAGVFPRRAETVLAGLPRGDGRPFVAALPQAVLASPEGALAVMAHADLAWSYGFRDIRMRHGQLQARNRPSRFQAVFRSILDGCRAGVAHHELLRYLGETSVELAMLYHEDAMRADHGGDRSLDRARSINRARAGERARTIDKASLFMLRNDLAGYILLGDPAVRLPLAREAHAGRAVDGGEGAGGAAGDLAARAARVLGIAPVPDGAGPGLGLGSEDGGEGPASGVFPVADMEEAVLALLRGDGERAIAARLGITRAALVRWVEIYQAAGRAALERLAAALRGR